MESRKLYMISEFTDPCFHVDIAINRLAKLICNQKVCGILISKNVNACRSILKYCKEYDIPLIVHATVTGLGGTVMEPNVIPWQSVMDGIKELIDDKIIDANDVVIRIDPIVPFYSKTEDIDKILDESVKIGINRCRVSVVDYYTHAIDRMRAKNLQHSQTFQISDEDKRKIINDVINKTYARKMTLSLCAEYIPESIKLIAGKWINNRGCASIYEWANKGISLDPIARVQRKMCTCDVDKSDLLYGLEKGCSHKCLYCYWKW